MEFPVLSALIFLPLLSAGVIAVCTRDSVEGNAAARWIALLTTILVLGISLLALSAFDNSHAGYQLVEQHPWFVDYNIAYHLGVDGISLAMIILTTVLMPFCIVCSWESITSRVREFMMAFLVLEALVIGVFAALDLLLFYLFFEAVLLPMYLIIGVWGADKRVYAAYKFFLYTLAGSVLLLLAILYLYFTFGTMDIAVLSEQASSDLPLNIQQWLFVAMFASFAVKVPMWPLHTWLPDAHVQAPTAGSVILAGILLKMGGYGFLRFSLPMLPEASQYFAPYIYTLSVVAVIYTSLVALVQQDMKKLIAYSSVAHMGYVTLGIFSFTQQGMEGAIFQMISHGVVSGALFLCVGVLYDRMHTKAIDAYGGVTHVMPYFAFVFMLFTMASVGLPATSGFVGEMLVLVGAFQASQWAALGAASGLILGAAYMLVLYRRVMFGALANHEVEQLRDLSSREMLLFIPLMLAVLWLGIYPKPVFGLISVPVLQIVAQTGGQEQSAASALPKEAEAGESNAQQNHNLEDEAQHPANNKIGNKPGDAEPDDVHVHSGGIHASSTSEDKHTPESKKTLEKGER